MKTWKIWFDQVNAQCFEIDARTEESAILKAQREWNSTFKNPEPADIELEGETYMDPHGEE